MIPPLFVAEVIEFSISLAFNTGGMGSASSNLAHLSNVFSMQR